ncbi:MAG: universal stress protein [Calditrichaeota bacterium]|nr:MAG: universal stress protein [Calditrichota bacterium]
MKKILLILSFLRRSTKSIEEALRLAKEQNAELLVLFVLDIDYADKIVHQLTDEGWIGGKPSEQLYTSLLKEYKTQAEEIIEDIVEKARELKVKVRPFIKGGTLLDETMKLCRLEDPDLIIITRRKRSRLSRLIHGSTVKILKEIAPCEVKIVDED